MIAESIVRFFLPIPAPYQVRGKLQQESSVFWIPGRVSLARNGLHIHGDVNLCESPGRAVGLPRC